MITDTAFYRNPAYHAADDAPEKLNYPAMGRVVDGLFQTLKVLECSSAFLNGVFGPH